MLKLSESARKELEAFFSDKPKSAVRIYLAPGGCSGCTSFCQKMVSMPPIRRGWNTPECS